MTRPRIVAAALMLAAVLLGLTAGAYLTIGKNHDMCGSTLSRVDEHGDYSPDRPKLCASSYSASRAAAWLFGVSGIVAFVGATCIEVREQIAADLRSGGPAHASG